MKTYGAERQSFPYWKVQIYRHDTLSWFDIQKQHTDKTAAESEAEAERAKGRRVRLIQIERNGRNPLPEPPAHAHA